MTPSGISSEGGSPADLKADAGTRMVVDMSQFQRRPERRRLAAGVPELAHGTSPKSPHPGDTEETYH